jgi:energy-converting hydrogenase A subunit R
MEGTAICFDLEGPLSPQDNAYEVLWGVEGGKEVFEVISRYDDLLTLEGRGGYEPGDTLKLILPFLLLHGIGERRIEEVSRRARLVPGARETILYLQARGWHVHIISTSYQQHAFSVGERLGVPRGEIASTPLPLDSLSGRLGEGDLAALSEMEEVIRRDLHPRMDDHEILRTLDPFFFGGEGRGQIREILREVRVVGGSRKVEALRRFAEKDGLPMERIVAVGDSITDFKMLRAVKEGRGLAVVFNGNEHALPDGDVGLASLDLRFLLAVTSPFPEGGREGALRVVRRLSGKGDPSLLLEALPPDLDPLPSLRPLPHFHCLGDLTEDGWKDVRALHGEFRARMRGEAARLG